MASPEEIQEEFLKLKNEDKKTTLREAKKVNPEIFGNVSKRGWMRLNVDNGFSKARDKDRYPYRKTSQPAISKGGAYANFLKQRRQELAFAKHMISEEEITTRNNVNALLNLKLTKGDFAAPPQPANDDTTEEQAEITVPNTEEHDEQPAVDENLDESHPEESLSSQCNDE
ncbi:hypothetical protein FOL47_009132 [Perkinsus chesapeaki]|uniref:Uncharacterized protein n=1 Tax=Perkinsus chesapeaki TaxID=330153 RepID=A0A7J6LAB8_PERCH|nr:hypothetical protein FOL47_009132 [Perkinsus chesapeaki]